MRRNKYLGQGWGNFSAGPASLPPSVWVKLRDDLARWQSDGGNIFEISHRSERCQEIVRNCEQLVRELLAIPDTHAIFFMQGGARLNYDLIPLNFIRDHAVTAQYLVTGHWSNLAYESGATNVSKQVYARKISVRDDPLGELELRESDVFCHYVANETANGIEFLHPPQTALPLFADMTSNILGAEISIERYGFIYASMQKNMGVAGLNLLIARKKTLDEAKANMASSLSYSYYAQSASLAVTVPMVQIYIASLYLQWVVEQGGVIEMAKRASMRASKVYDFFDIDDFYFNDVPAQWRSRYNFVFKLPTKDQEIEFLRLADKYNFIGLKGHGQVGGLRINAYNATQMHDLDNLLEFMLDFKNGKLSGEV